MGKRISIATGSAMSLSTSYTVAELTTVPNECELEWLRGTLSSISSASQVTWYLAADADGDIPLTDEILVDIVSGKTTSTKGGANSSIDLDYAVDAGGASGSLWVVAKVDAGTATMTPSLVYVEEL